MHVLADRMGLSCANNKIIRFFLLQDPPHTLHVFWCKSPVPLCIEISQVQEFVLSADYPCNSTGDLAGDKGLTPSWGFMIEQNTIGRKEIISLTVITGHPVGVNFRTGVGAPRMKRGIFFLRWICCSKHLAGGGLIEFYRVFATPYCFEETGSTECSNIAGIFRGVKTDPDMALRTEMVYFIRTDIIHHICDLFRVREISIM